jgi:tetratricopeptide (TPR) repeat protein
MHDLLRTYAAGLATAAESAGEPPEEPRSALERLFDYYAATAAAAMDRLHPGERHRRPRIPPVTTPTPDMADPDAARAWLDTEVECLVVVAAYTAHNGWPAHAVRLSRTLFRYLAGGRHAQALTVHGHACRAARKAQDPAGEAHALSNLGTAHGQLGQHVRAIGCFRQAHDLARQAGDRVGQARALGNLGLVERRLGRYGPAADCYEQT